MRSWGALGNAWRPRGGAAREPKGQRPRWGNSCLRKLRFIPATLLLVWTLATGEFTRADVVYVDDDAPLGGDGCTWNTAFRYLQDALTSAPRPAEIHVAGGNYNPDRDEAGHFMLGDHLASFQLRSGVAIYGGFAGLADPANPDHRDPSQYTSVLSGDLAGNDGPDFANYGENAYHVVDASGVDASAILDGVTVYGGYAHGLSPHHAGGGLYVMYGAPTLNRCLIARNFASSGGGMFSYLTSTPVMTDCHFTGNMANWGGALLNEGRTVMLNCTFSANVARYSGAGVYNWLASYLTLVNCTFAANFSPEGRAVSCNSEYYQITVCIRDCILRDGYWEIWDDGPSEISVTYSNVQGCWPGVGNISADPLFADPDGPDDDPFTGEDNDYHLLPGSPCIDAGDPDGGWPPALAQDGDGQLRIWDGDGDGLPRVDMGVDEYGSFVPGDVNCDGLISNFDINAFLLALTDPPAYDQAFPHCARSLADLNADGAVDNFDISPFVALLTAP